MTDQSGGEFRAPNASNTPPVAAAKPAPKALGVPTPASLNTGRSKQVLRPGRSLMDWIRLANSGEPMTSLKGGQMRGVTPAELAKHNTQNDCWMSIHDQVYDVTRYMEYHPGGVEELMRGAGQDATELFNQVHRWVNYSSMLSHCLVGPLVLPRSNYRRRRTIGEHHDMSPKHLSALSTLPVHPLPSSDRPRWDWKEEDATFTLIISYPDPVPHSDYCSLSIQDSGKIRLHTNLPPHVHNFIFMLSPRLQWSSDNMPQADGHECRMVLEKREAGTRVPTIGQVLRDEWKMIKDTTLGFHKCAVISRTEVNHDTLLYCLQWPDGFHMPIPLGHHIRLRLPIEGIELARSYTPVCSSLVEQELTIEERQGRRFYLMIKIYPDGCLTPYLALCEPDSHISISSPEGPFSSLLEGYRDSRRLLMLAAGTGFTPMVRLIRAALFRESGPPKEPTEVVQLFFFNKRHIDIMWRSQLDALAERFPDRFSVVYVLSEPDDTWTGPRGRVSEDLLKEHVRDADKPEAMATLFACACGPEAFTNTAINLFSKTLNLADRQMHAFLG